MERRGIRPYEGLINRAHDIFGIVDMLPDNMSDAEVEGVLHVLPIELKKTLGAFFLPRVRKSSLEFFRLTKKWLDGAFEARQTGKKVFLVPFNFPPEIVHSFQGAR